MPITTAHELTLQAAKLENKTVLIQTKRETLIGRVADLDSSNAYLVLVGGERRHVHTGDVVSVSIQ